MMPEHFLQRTFLDNTVEAWLWAACILLAGLVFARIISRWTSRLAYAFFKKYSRGVRVETFLVLLTRPVSVFFILIILYLTFDRLHFPESWQLVQEEKFGVRMVLAKLFHSAVILSITWIFMRTVDFFGVVFQHRAQFTETKMDDMLIPFIKGGVKIIVAMFGFFVILGSVFKLNIATLVGGLGIGGLAIALAAKETLENLLGSVLIFMDKPFVVGEQVKVGQLEGIIESIGFRSTRIRTFERAVVSVPNKKMMDAEVENQTRREHRRARFSINLMYNTGPEVMSRISAAILNAIQGHSMVEKETAWVRFREFGPSSLDLQINYYVRTPELERFLEVREELNYAIVRIVRDNGADFAYPSTTVYLKQEGSMESQEKTLTQ